MQFNIRKFILLPALLSILYVISPVTAQCKVVQTGSVNNELQKIADDVKSAIPSDWKITVKKSDEQPNGWGDDYNGFQITVEKSGSKKTSSGDKGHGSQLPRPFAVTVWFVPLSKGISLQKAFEDSKGRDPSDQTSTASVVGANKRYLLFARSENEEENKMLNRITNKFNVRKR
jgi:hypothetical protein